MFTFSVITLPTLRWQKLLILVYLLYFLYCFVHWYVHGFFPILLPFLSYRSSKYCDNNNCRFFSLLKAIAKSKKIKKERQLSRNKAKMIKSNIFKGSNRENQFLLLQYWENQEIILYFVASILFSPAVTLTLLNLVLHVEIQTSLNNHYKFSTYSYKFKLLLNSEKIKQV